MTMHKAVYVTVNWCDASTSWHSQAKSDSRKGEREGSVSKGGKLVGGGWGGSTAGLGHDVNPAPPRRISFAAEDWKRECIFRPGMALANGVVWLAPLSLCQQQAVRDWNTSHWPTALSNGASGSSVAVHTLGRKYTKINWGETGKFVLVLVHAVSCECE